MMAEIDVYGVGNALVDIQTQVADQMLADLNIEKGVMTLVDEEQQSAVLSKLAGSPLHRCAGGSAANTIVALADLGGSAAYAGKVADDEIGSFFLRDMRELGIGIDVTLKTVYFSNMNRAIALRVTRAVIRLTIYRSFSIFHWVSNAAISKNRGSDNIYFFPQN